jgi:hypothetical protein
MTTRGWVGARHPKEVARMLKTNRTMTAQSPSFGVSAYGQTSIEAAAISACAGVTDLRVSTSARIRQTGGVMGLGATDKAFPGTSAWRPPSC